MTNNSMLTFFFLLIYFFIFKTEGRQANAKAQEVVDHSASFFVKKRVMLTFIVGDTISWNAITI
jgi:hypothetical protein